MENTEETKIPAVRVELHRVISWWLAAFSFITITLGYSISRRWVPMIDLFTQIHTIVEWSFILLFIFHTLYTIIYVKVKSRVLWRGVRRYWVRTLQDLTKYLIFIFTLLVILSGFNRYPWFAQTLGDLIPFSYHRIFDFALVMSIIVHVMAGAKILFARRHINTTRSTLLILLLGGGFLSAAIYLELPQPVPPASIFIGSTSYTFDPASVTTVRPDLFVSGEFSMFDILVHLEAQGDIIFTYHFNSTLDTHVIESVNGQTNWWYYAYYSGGYVEPITLRMDYYLWKPDSYFALYQETPEFFTTLYQTYAEEVTRLSTNNGTLILPHIVIDGNTFYQEFFNITITAHDLRNETLQFGTITTLDVILTLGDLGLITYDLQWYDTLGTASVVRSYWVSRINSDSTTGRCGFNYETGDRTFDRSSGNFIQVPADTRILLSPEYTIWFWKCL
jgi:hypothetical protein